MIMTDEQKEMILAEERYATIRVEVRDAYDKCRYMMTLKQSNDSTIKSLEDKKNWLTKKKIQKSIDEIVAENTDIETKMNDLREYLKPLAEEMKVLEEKLGYKAEEYYGNEDGWWMCD